MIKRFFFKTKETLEAEIDQTDAKLAMLKVQLAAQMIRLARQTNEIEPLEQAEAALTAAREYYDLGDCPTEILIVQRAMAETCLELARAVQNKTDLLRAKIYYRNAITLASMLDEEEMRVDMRAKIVIIDSLLGKRPKAPSLFSAA